MLDPGGCIADNPFYVLELAPDCARADVEREGQKLLGMLELHLAQAATYPTPMGPQRRTPEKVRQAMADLRDPQRRLMFEVWASIPAESTLEDAIPQAEDGASKGPSPWRDARRLLGWGP